MPRKVRLSNWRDKQIAAEAERIVRGRMWAAGAEIQGTAVRKLSKGQPVRRTRSGRLVGLAPSAPGEPPRTLTGRLKQSVAFTVTKESGKLILRVGSNVVYARRLELGFHGKDSAGRNMATAARPWLRPSVLESLTKIKKIFGVR